MKKCTGCGHLDTIPLTGEALACCPDSRYKKLTVIQELIEIINERPTEISQFNASQLLALIEPLLEKEKEQVINDYLKGDSNGCGCYDYATKKDAEEYYNQTYNQNK